ncbi:SPW repeat protein [Pontibacter silvestris]|uniref:SPW repeat protein n=1 Tax=Pontibacter silvestris TaxID=2305183 RepID=A0ABW4WRC2_9BACT|nr:SPW repeat protein [Pontibacter silvestris]MCC9138557.1 SPW repeat protein [Pontibacter silvestris]
MWAQIINAILGIWLIVAPAVLGADKAAADNDHIIGPIIVSFAVISWWEATRVVRLYNLPLGAWLLLAPWILGYNETTVIISDMMVGALVIGFSFVKGKTETRYGGGWSAIWKSDSLHEREAKKQSNNL